MLGDPATQLHQPGALSPYETAVPLPISSGYHFTPLVGKIELAADLATFHIFLILPRSVDNLV